MAHTPSNSNDPYLNEAKKTYGRFIWMAKIGIISVVVILVGMALFLA